MFSITLRHAEACGNEKGIGVFHSFVANFTTNDVDGMGLFLLQNLKMKQIDKVTGNRPNLIACFS